jgi:hypothetical protein
MSVASSSSRSYPLLAVCWTIFEVFLFVIWFWILIWVFINIFRSPDLSGLAKALVPVRTVHLQQRCKALSGRQRRRVVTDVDGDRRRRPLQLGPGLRSQRASGGQQLLDPRAGFALKVLPGPEQPQHPEQAGSGSGSWARYQRTAAARLPASACSRSNHSFWPAPRSGRSACSASAR